MDKESLKNLADKHLNETGKDDVEILLDEESLEAAAIIYLLGAINARWTKGLISDDEARHDYERLGLAPDKAARVRTTSEHVRNLGTRVN